MRAREFVKRATIYTLGLGLFAYELFIATIEGFGLNARGFWGEPSRPAPPDSHVASILPPPPVDTDAFEADVAHLAAIGVKDPRAAAAAFYHARKEPNQS